MIEEQTDREQENGDQGKNNCQWLAKRFLSCHVLSSPLHVLLQLHDRARREVVVLHI
jgi:hypothetical protein